MYLEQEAALLSEKHWGNKTESKKAMEKTENLITKQQHIINYDKNK